MNLNLSRKWRSKNFDQIIGQVMPVRMLKNSLYLNQFFPVYLFSGQHGCGKTSTARIFAAAINCFALSNFQQKPRDYSVPCAVCDSCRAMNEGRHPDFFEIDAASHTGVDMIRQIIEAATLLPLMGTKKVYLIDEAHMLSKAAFNALLKILEEPPASVLFILATTDEQKILETVQSRCFKLFFPPIPQETLLQHLIFLCEQEKITFHPSGLELIAQESGGSARDAINLLEQVRFSSNAVTKDVVMKSLGRIDNATLLHLLEVVFSRDAQKCIQALHEMHWQSYRADILWRQLMTLLRALLWCKYGAPVESLRQHQSVLMRVAQKCSVSFLCHVMQTLYTHEQLFVRTMAGHELLEVIFLQLCYKKGGNDGTSGANSLSSVAPVKESSDKKTADEDDEQEDHIDEDEDASSIKNDGLWIQFVRGIERLDDALLSSIIKQAKFLGFDASKQIVTVHFAQGGTFFKDVVEAAQEQWQTLLHDLFGVSAQLVVTFDAPRLDTSLPASVHEVSKVSTSTDNQPKLNKVRQGQTASITAAHKRTGRSIGQPVMHDYGPALNVSNADQWPITHMFLRHFPGQVYEIRAK